MQNHEVKAITVETPFDAIGRVFTGDYAKSPQYIMELCNLLNKHAVPFVANKVMGVYYDNPNEKKVEDLKSFQGVFLTDYDNYEDQKIDPSLTKLSLLGNFLYVKVTGDPVKSIYEGYDALFHYIQQHNVKLKSNAGYQVSSFENGVITTEIYMQTD